MSQPFLTVSAAGLGAAGVGLSAAEAVACVVLVGDALDWSADAPDLAHVVLRSDGRVDLAPVEGTAKARVESYARLLHRLLPESATAAPARVPGALRLAVARGLGVLDAPPFASPREFRTAIERFLTQKPEELIVGVVVRWAEAMGSRPEERPPERRLASPRVDVLRRMLREADLERFALLHDGAPVVDTAARSTRRPSRTIRHAGAPPTRLERPAAPEMVRPEPEWRRPPPEPGHAEPRPVHADIQLLPVSAHGSRSRWPAVIAAAVLAAVLGWAGAYVFRGWPIDPPAPQRQATDAKDGRGANAQPGQTVQTEPPGSALPSRSEADAPEAPASAAPEPSSAAVSRTPTPGATATTGGLMPADARPAAGAGDALAPVPADEVVSSRGIQSGFQLANVVDGPHRTQHVTLSPDGSRVAFDSDRDGLRGVYVAARDGTGVHRVSGSGFAAGPAWTPDGRRLAILRSEPDMPQVLNLWVLDLESGAERRLTGYRYGEISPASWLPDGRRITYAQEDKLHVMDTESGATRNYESPVAGRSISTVAAGPDGRHIAFQVQDDGMWLLDLHDGSLRRALEDPSVERLAWSPEGRSVAYYSRRAGHWGVWVMASR